MFGSTGRLAVTGAWSSGGPADDGRLKPDVVAPSLSVFPLSDGFDVAPNTVSCPNISPIAGLHCGHGTSIAAPVATGAVAVLISAAKQRGISYTAQDLYEAVTMSARHVPGKPVFKQGNGVIDVSKTLDWLSRKAGKLAPRFVVRAPVRTKLGQDLPVPNQGGGLYEHEGWFPGSKGVRHIIVRRVTGGQDSSVYRFSLIGNDQGTFRTSESVTLPLNKDVSIPIAIEPRRNGAHSAILQIELDKEPLARVALTVVAATPLNDANGFKATVEAENRPGHIATFYIHVPPGTVALRAHHEPAIKGLGSSFTPPTGGMINYIDVLEIREAASALSEAVPSPVDEQAVYYPTPGVWKYQFLDYSVDHRSPVRFRTEFDAVTSDSLGKELTILQGERQADGRPTQRPDRPYYRAVWGKRISGTVRFNATDLPAIIDLNMLENITSINGNARVVFPGGTETRLLTLMALECRTEQCHAKGIATGEGQAGFFVYKPKPGKWRLAVDSSRLPSGEAVVEYEVFVAVESDAPGKISGMKGGENSLPGINWKISFVPNTALQCYIEIVSDQYKTLVYKVGSKGFAIIDQENHIPLRRMPEAAFAPASREMTSSLGEFGSLCSRPDR